MQSRNNDWTWSLTSRQRPLTPASVGNPSTQQRAIILKRKPIRCFVAIGKTRTTPGTARLPLEPLRWIARPTLQLLQCNNSIWKSDDDRNYVLVGQEHLGLLFSQPEFISCHDLPTHTVPRKDDSSESERDRQTDKQIGPRDSDRHTKTETDRQRCGLRRQSLK